MALSCMKALRPRKGSGYPVKIRALVVAGTVAFVLLAPTAGAVLNGSTGPAGSSGRVTAHHAVKHKAPTGHKASKPAKKVTPVANVKPLPAELPTVPAQPAIVPYVDVRASVPPDVDSNACVDTGTDCTNQQLCDIWGMNCPSVPPSVELDPASTSDTSTGADPAAP
jgi:hypothetical protein